MKNRLFKMSYFFILTGTIILSGGCEKETKNTPPVASFTATPEMGTPATAFTFDATSSYDAQDLATILLVRWDWENDGVFDTDFSTNQIVSHQFTSPGVYTVTLEVKDSGQLGNSMTKSVTVEGKIPEVSTDTVFGISAFSAICGGEVTDDFGLDVTQRGICWDIAPNPTISGNHSDEGSGTGKFESAFGDLLNNTTYYVRAYATNEAGTAYGNQVEFNTLDAWTCGEPVLVNHLAGAVAPVDKSISYGTVAGIPGEPDKCWITRNLGADRQAESVDDATEASAGWYWQFNRKQGYKHDGVMRTPDTEWISLIDEASNWLVSEDPCRIELGEGWRIPTQQEWVNVNDIGYWADWNGPWNSGLKMHAAGFLSSTDGSLQDRGVQGYGWSNLEGSNTTAWYIRFRSYESVYKGNEKAFAITLRCVKD